MAGIPIIFKSATLNLEGVLHLPESGGTGDVPAVVLCHPHPLYGGNMDNNVIMAVSRALLAEGIAAFRFNFRGVGASDGRFDNGVGEKDDIRAALAALGGRGEIDAAHLGLMGYSFGGMVALDEGRANTHVRAIGCVAPVLIPGVLQDMDKPLIIISGTDDHVVAPADIYREAATMGRPATVTVVPGVDHFWWGHESAMAGKLAEFFREALK
ncbi:MAG TPA: hypothetical protein DCQ14_06310 [Firmicutes bacterium]|nr:hypothetical protein [Bacillota bacterium]